MWIDRVVELKPRQRLVAIKNISLAEEHLHDHFPADENANLQACPVMPASLIIEGAAQTAGILVGHAEAFREKVILAKIAKAELTEDAAPGHTLRHTADILSIDTTGASTRSTVELLDHANPAAGFREIGRIDLLFSHIDNNRAGTAFPEHNFVFGDAFKTLLRISGVTDWEHPAPSA